ncbi:AMP-binding protein [Peredibacter starrii]|uniref:AMP-binding protein n=1 Tax=Peredibacter starrii TaxID=28202 RepID=A0AAX4HJT6_9BACT|nr:AMP-binding protein [Peredibacter starrii]WPU63509.1 AMP-binding protein [Peredibacter starrii]
MSKSNTQKFQEARDFLLNHRLDYDKCVTEFKWPELQEFNWARDWFDVYAQNSTKTALWIRKDDGTDIKLSYQELSERSDRVASFLQGLGVIPGERIIVLLPNVVPIWELMLASIKVGAILVPTSTLATKEEIQDRLTRSGAKFLVTEPSLVSKVPETPGLTKILFGGTDKNWQNYEDAYSSNRKYYHAKTKAHDPLLLYFTSGTTSKAKLVQHTHQSYPVGHLSTMYWIGIQENDLHQNISSPGWAKHAWSSFFAPFNAGATTLVHDYARFNAQNSIKLLHDAKVNTLCAPPTVWRMMILEDLGLKPLQLREIVSAGEPLNPEVIEKVENSWGLQIRDGYGQSETTAQIGNSPGQTIKPGSMGRPLPGYKISLLDSNYEVSKEGEVSIHLDQRPLSLMSGYVDDLEKTQAVMQKGFYRTGDEAMIDDDGYIFFVGRGDDVFKSSDYRISPFELESVLIEHDAIAEAAIVPSPDPLRTNLAKAYVTLKPGIKPSREIAEKILKFAKDALPPYKRIRKIEFQDLPKTISGKIRRVELRKAEAAKVAKNEKGEQEYFLSDFE